MRRLTIALVPFVLAGCGTAGPVPSDNDAALDNGSSAANTANAAAAVNVASEIANLPEASQQGVFLRAIRDANISCRDVVSAEPIDPIDGDPTWRAQCEQGDQHLVRVKPDGSAQVISRTDR